jgi:hypothetical protein
MKVVSDLPHVSHVLNVDEEYEDYVMKWFAITIEFPPLPCAHCLCSSLVPRFLS